MPNFHEEELPSGKKILKRFADNGSLENELHIEECSSGKTIHQSFKGDGLLARETHFYGPSKIMLARDYLGGKLFDETYIVNDRLVSRKSYDKARLAYEDMPAPDQSLVDTGAALLQMVSKERREKAAKAKQRTPNPDEARKNDNFCQEIISKGKAENAVEWIQTRQHTLGEKDWANSKKLVSRFVTLGCVRILACDIDDYSDKGQNTGHIVIELPLTGEARGKILKSVARMAAAAGYDGPLDDGQKYVYVKFD